MKAKHWLGVLAIGGILTGCATGSGTSGNLAAGAPAWVNTNGQSDPRCHKGNICGVDLASGIDDKSLAMDTADNRARFKVAQVLKDKVSGVADDLRAQEAAGHTYSARDPELGIKNFQHNFVDLTMTGATIIDRWRDPKTGDIYSLCLLDIKSMQNTVDQITNLSTEMRHRIREDMGKSLKELREEQDRARKSKE